MVINNSSRPIAGNKSDIVCNNGVVHIIDEIILPPVFSINNLATVLVLRDDIFRDMFMVLLLNNLTDIIEGWCQTICYSQGEADSVYLYNCLKIDSYGSPKDAEKEEALQLTGKKCVVSNIQS